MQGMELQSAFCILQSTKNTWAHGRSVYIRVSSCVAPDVHVACSPYYMHHYGAVGRTTQKHVYTNKPLKPHAGLSCNNSAGVKQQHKPAVAHWQLMIQTRNSQHGCIYVEMRNASSEHRRRPVGALQEQTVGERCCYRRSFSRVERDISSSYCIWASPTIIGEHKVLLCAHITFRE